MADGPVIETERKATQVLSMFEKIAANTIGTARARGTVTEDALMHYLANQHLTYSFSDITSIPPGVVERSRMGFYDELASYLERECA